MLMMICILSCPCPSVPTRIITTLLFQAYTITWVILLIVLLYAGIMLVRINWYTGDSEIAIRDDIAISYQYCMPGATNYVCPMGTVRIIILQIHLPLLSRLLLLL